MSDEANEQRAHLHDAERIPGAMTAPAPHGQPDNANAMLTAASESIRIAETFFPKDLTRQRALAREIVAAINLCEAELAGEIMRSLR